MSSSPDATSQPPETGPTAAEPGGAAESSTRRALYVAAGIALVAVVGLAAMLFGPANDGGDATDVLALPFTYGDGTTGTLADFEGRPLVVNFYAAWCPPCRAEIPAIEATHQALTDEVQILGISHDVDETSWQRFDAETGLTYPTGFQPRQEIFEALDLTSMPSTVLVSADGEIVDFHVGIIDETTLRELIAEHLTVEASEA